MQRREEMTKSEEKEEVLWNNFQTASRRALGERAVNKEKRAASKIKHYVQVEQR